jgi:DNA polymerase-3 subunit delta'
VSIKNKSDILVLHKSAEEFLSNYLKLPTQGLLISGKKGLGAGSAAKNIAGKLAGSEVIIVNPEKNSISIDKIRELYTLTRDKRDLPLAVVIVDSECMSAEAQNALLKLLEEPPKNVYFLLSSHDANQLLPTILSRVQILYLKNISSDDSEKLIKSLLGNDTDDKIQKIMFLASGLPAEIIRLDSDSEYFDNQASIVGDARRFISEGVYSRLIIINKYASDRDAALNFTELIGNIIFRLVRSHDVNFALKLEAISRTLENIKQNGHVKTQLMFLAVSL